MKKNYWLRLDFDFLSDTKIQNIHFEKGNDAIVAYEVAVIQLYKSGGKFSCDKYKQIAYIAHTTEEVVKYVIEQSDLFVCEGGYFYSNRVMDELSSQTEISQKRAENGKLGAQKRWENGKKMANAKNKMANAIKKDGKTIANYNTIQNNTIQDNIDNIENIENNLVLIESDIKEKNMTPEEMVAIWNTGCGELSKARPLSEERKRKAKLRISEFGKTRDEQVNTMKEITRRLAQSDFANGKTGGTWKADFGWIITNSENWVKVIEGRYDNKDIRAGVKDIRDIKNVNDLWNE